MILRGIRSRFLFVVAALFLGGRLLWRFLPDWGANTLLAELVLAVLACLVALYMARWFTEPLDRLTEYARRFASGEWTVRPRPSAPLEIDRLGAAMDQMAAQWLATRNSLEFQIQRSEAVLAEMTDGVMLLDSQGRVIKCNPAAETILAVRESELNGKSFTLAVRDHEMVACLRGAESKMQEQTCVVERPGTKRFLRMVAAPIQSGGMVHFLVLFQDLTQIRRLETIRRDFISNISHELRTPLAGLQAVVETLNAGALEDLPAAYKFLDRMEYEVSRLSQLVNELLELSSLESGRAPLEIAPVDLAPLIGRSIERLRPQAERAGVRLENAPVASVQVKADAARIEQVLVNLIHNSIKFTPAGGSIECGLKSDDKSATISIRDTGIGIAEVDVPRVFERFYKADKVRGGGGTGLGLAIAKHTVELHGGRIWVESIAGKETTVSFTLPLG